MLYNAKKDHISVYLIILLLGFSCSKVDEGGSSLGQLQSQSGDLRRTSIRIFETAEKSENRLDEIESVYFEKRKQALENERSIFVNPQKTFQSLIGIGGAITDASAEVFAEMPLAKQEELLKAYYTEEGINYSLIRTTIHSADFGTESYTYVDEGDSSLSSFSIDHDLKYRIPLIKKANETAGRNLLLYASPWSPPAFMKTNNNMLQGGKLLSKYYASWASYYAKFIESYERQGLSIWGVTIQNEPMAKQRWESCIYTAEEERDFLKNFLGPTMKAAGYGDKKIVVWDHNRDLMSDRANVIFNDPDASKYAWGIGFHWYETWAGGDPKFENLSNIRESYPEKNLLFTEGCNEAFDPTKYEFWPNAERYGRSMINDFNRGTVGWTDWNILLNEEGGPNHVGNFCFAPVHADLKTKELIYTPTYFYIGHFSKFLPPGSVRVSTTTSHTDILSTTFLNTAGEYVTIVMNETNKPIEFSIYFMDQEAKLFIPGHAIQTLIY